MAFNLSTQDLEQFLSADALLLYNAGGVFAVDKLPKNIFSKKIFIINTDPSYLPGKHWVVVFFPTDSFPEFFDSFGKDPTYYNQSIFNFLIERNSRGFVYNSKCIQAVQSSACGLFCLYYLYFRIRGYSFEKILERFGQNLEHNDLIVVDFFAQKR